MLDHLVGKPSANWKRTQVLLTMIVGYWIIIKGDTNRLPKILQKFNKSIDGNAPWKITVSAWMAYYLIQNLFHLVGLNAPEPLARLYKRSFYRATWILTALDAGFFTAQPLKPIWLRHICSILFSVYYLVFADAAEEKVRRVRATMSVEQMRVSWEKVATNPILSIISKATRPRLSIRRILQFDRPDYHQHLSPTEVYFFYAGDPDTLAQHNTILLQFPGGGFVSMPPPCHEDAIAAWAKQTGLPICSVNYKKAPEYPYPWPIDECFDLYVTLIRDRGKSFGLSGDKDLNIIVLGDSAGGNVTTAVTLKILQHNEQIKQKSQQSSSLAESFLTPSPTLTSIQMQQSEPLFNTKIPVPCGIILIYPALDFEMSCWMSPDQLSLIRAESKTQLFRSSSLESLWQTKDHFSHASPLSVVPDIEKTSLWRRALDNLNITNKSKTLPTASGSSLSSTSGRDPSIRERVHQPSVDKHAWGSSRLAMTSRMSFFNDRIISPDMMRAMAILYLGPHANPDFDTDYLLSPIVAPFELLAKFPKTFMICGEKDPFVDDTVIFASRIRQAKTQFPSPLEGHPNNVVRVKFLEGISHAFLQMMAFLPEARQAAKTIGAWIRELADDVDETSGLNSFSDSTSLPLSSSGTNRTLSPELAEVNAAVHVAEIITSEKEMINRRKQQLVDGLY
ncbi:Alpha/Beta hydrolase protein [Halteromyces radiatus]|uniref:Alpha/Beta hydrolase protein n=1 Tax=Halteromyces radiatus TaxID=101107 RepID=UPI0022201D16|nr:Alpha/Beta hydrolase protein [Halteromyces radiatus]KAI8086082.1 Alpha/Beta hydrolase protein [Halteromyces radiatus]